MSKNDNNFGNDNLINGILGAPLMGMIGGIPGIIASIFLGATADYVDANKALEEKTKFVPYHRPTAEDIKREEEEDIEATKEIEKILWEHIASYGEKERKFFKKYYYKIFLGSQNLPFKKYDINGRIGLYKQKESYCPLEDYPAELYYRPSEFLKRLQQDIKKYDCLKMYRINHGFLQGEYMYTVNHGKSFVVCGSACREKKPIEKGVW